MASNAHGRRAADFPAHHVAPVEQIVQQGILLKHALSTVAAIEYLTARDIDPTVIRRVIAGNTVRESDRIALELEQWEAQDGAVL